jgi:hypothetical protein
MATGPKVMSALKFSNGPSLNCRNQPWLDLVDKAWVIEAERIVILSVFHTSCEPEQLKNRR